VTLPAALDRAVRVRADGFAWLGAFERPLPRAAWARLDAAARRAFLLHALAGRIYASYYAPGRPVPSARTPRPREPDASFVRALARAHPERTRWDPGWRVEGRDGDAVVAAKDGLRVRAAAASVRDGALRRPAGSCGPSPGFWLTGAGWPGPSTRLYWHLRPGGAAPLVRFAGTTLRDAGIAYRLKVLHHPASYVRCDAGVLVVPAARSAEARALALAFQRRLRPHMRARTPPWTRPLAAGLAEAPDPATGESFGLACSRLAAEGLLDARAAGARTAEARRAHVAAAFA